MLLNEFLRLLEVSPVDAVESPELLMMFRRDPDFYKRLAAPDRWRLLFGLGISLLDYSGRPDLEIHFLELPGGLPALRCWQICEALACVDFRLDGINWAEELQLHIPLTLAQVEACDAALSSPEMLDRLNVLIAESLAFLENCDDFLVAPARRPKGLLQRGWTALRSRLHGDAVDAKKGLTL